jgi:hypothetical protein
MGISVYQRHTRQCPQLENKASVLECGQLYSLFGYFALQPSLPAVFLSESGLLEMMS